MRASVSRDFNMKNPQLLEEVIDRITNAIPADVGRFSEDTKQHMRKSLQGILGRFELVTREEFDVQKLVLARTREKLEQLVECVRDMEIHDEENDPAE